MKKLKLFALAALALVGYAGVANAADATMLDAGRLCWNIFLDNFNGYVSGYSFLLHGERHC